MSENKTTILHFEEDAFDLDAIKKAADDARREKARIKRIHRKISFGKIAMGIAALFISIFLYYLATLLFTMF
ncbi:MAG: hypothetical protein FWC32_08970 [Firmicutes bacterium]|nr:hypothetical protein [Bacillota bacterium]